MSSSVLQASTNEGEITLDTTEVKNAPLVLSKGRGPAWNEDETTELVRAAAAASNDPATGSGISAAEHGRHIRALFIKRKCKPERACTLRKTGCELDCRRLGGRSTDGCQKQWDKIRAECTKYKSCYDRVRVIAMRLTGNPEDQDIARCASLLFSDGGNSISHLYDCVPNPKY
ncbi:hypothetical protein FGB62_103g012 [Gracilaria domingensis]|nr:hypothetical protein FGB62_103g012 [Gracilaria domingensis]